MFGRTKFRFSVFVGMFSVARLTCIEAHAATKTVDLDGNPANGAESQCDLNVLQTFPVQIENKVTNKTGGDAYSFAWPSAGPGGFTSSVPAGTAGGVGATWVWTTNQSVFSYTGSTCATDVCFTQTGGPDSIASFCSDACLADATSVTIAKGAIAGTVVLSWAGGQSTFTIYRSTSKIGIVAPANAVGTTNTQSFTDTPPANVTVFYVVRGVDCTTRKACVTNADCSAPGDGTCISRGPFGVPGRSLFATDVTVSAASLTSSLITFFSPPTEIFRVISTANAGGSAETLWNESSDPMIVTIAAYPPGCCPANPDVPHQLNCNGTCVDYLNDPNNCGACGNVCGDGTYCTNGDCATPGGDGRSSCDGPCSVLDEAPTCVVNENTRTIPPGTSSTVCNPGGVLFKEVPTTIRVCGDGIPGVDGQCNNSATKLTTGTFNRLVPDTSRSVGNAYVTPNAAHVTADSSNDGLIGPGETASLIIDLLNAGPMNIADATATLSAPAVDLTDDGISNPVGVTIVSGSSSYGTIVGTPVSTNCTASALQIASNAVPFQISVPPGHPGDSSHPFTLTVAGTVDGGPFTMDVPIALGIADACDPSANTRDYDGVDGLSSPMAKLVPAGDPVLFPSKSFSAGSTRPLKLRMSCGGVNLTDATVDPPEIVALSEATRGVLDIRALNLNSDNSTNPDDPFFHFNNGLSGGQWTYNVRTALIGTGSFTLTIRIAGRKKYITGFVLE